MNTIVFIAEGKGLEIWERFHKPKKTRKTNM